MNLREFITKYLIEEVGKIKSNHPFLAFSVMSIGIEFLGKCLNYTTIEDICGDAGKGESANNFNYAVCNLKSFAKYSFLCDLSLDSGNWLYHHLRCGFAHNFMLKQGLSLSGGSNDFSDKTNIIIGCKDFYDDFYSACCELMEMEDKASLMAENFVDEENNITGTTTNN